jgi:hypothetical protein
MSKKLKLSPWHDGSVKPVRAGLYEREFNWGIDFCWFDKKWFVFGTCAKDAYFEFSRKNTTSNQSNLRWRGVLK